MNKDKYAYEKGEKCDCNGRTYPFTVTSYILCIECGRQYPMSGEEE